MGNSISVLTFSFSLINFNKNVGLRNKQLMASIMREVCVVAARRVIDQKAPDCWTSGTSKVISTSLKRGQLKSRSG